MATDSEGYVIINIGGTGTGKSTRTLNLLKQFCSKKARSPKTPFIFDVHGEYHKLKIPNCDMSFDLKGFLNKATTKTKTCIVFEEASIFFKHQSTGEDLFKLMVRKRHQENIIILNFHTLRKVPLYILDYTDTIYLGVTNDNQKIIFQKFGEEEKIISAYRKVLTNTAMVNNKYFFVEINF